MPSRDLALGRPWNTDNTSCSRPLWRLDTIRFFLGATDTGLGGNMVVRAFVGLPPGFPPTIVAVENATIVGM